jgi:hypothetical protein
MIRSENWDIGLLALMKSLREHNSAHPIFERRKEEADVASEIDTDNTYELEMKKLRSYGSDAELSIIAPSPQLQ